MTKFVITLDFELYWGVSDSRTVEAYRNNIEGAWDAIPRILKLFRQYDVHATWATVGMLMCRDHAQWCEIRPSILPGYARQQCSTYLLDVIAREYPKLFFARPLVEQILATPGQELATHTYSHFYCGEEGATPEQFTADLDCAQTIASEYGAQFNSLVFPRNQVLSDFVSVLTKSGIRVYRGNPDNWLYRDGHFTPGGIAGRVVRFADTWLPLTGTHVAHKLSATNGLVNIPASLYLRPWSRSTIALENLRLSRLKHAMTSAACSGGIFHLWWHPHNFGINIEENMAILKSLLQHYCVLRDQYGMRSLTMDQF